MGNFIDKVLLLILSFFIMNRYLTGGTLVVYVFLVLIVISLNTYLSGKRKICIAIQVIFAVLCLICPLLFCAAPAVLYDMLRNKNYIAVGLLVPALIWAAEQALSITSLCYMITLFLAAGLLLYHSELARINADKLRSVRDDSMEKEIILKERNAQILNNQDQEIYVARLQERNRIAREIHDNVGHMLSRALLQIGAMLAVHKEDPVHSQLTEVRVTLDTAMNNIRESVHDLHDESIDVEMAVENLLIPLQDSYHVRFEYDMEAGVPRDVKYAVIGIVKECISNIIKHSSNDMVDIILNEHPSMYQIVVHDYPNTIGRNLTAACGGDVKKEAEKGIGLLNIRNRVEGLNGTLYISNDRGFRVFATLPKM